MCPISHSTRHLAITLALALTHKPKPVQLRKAVITAGQLGLNTLDMEDRAVIVRNSNGEIVGCGILKEPPRNLLAGINIDDGTSLVRMTAVCVCVCVCVCA